MGLLSSWACIYHMSTLSLVIGSNQRQRKKDPKHEKDSICHRWLLRCHMARNEWPPGSESEPWMTSSKESTCRIYLAEKIHSSMTTWAWRRTPKFQMRSKPGWYHGFQLVRPQRENPVESTQNSDLQNWEIIKGNSFDLLSMQCKNRKLIQFS